nr:UDP galactose 4 epimerase [Hymenolepis microstoma]
MSNEFTVSLKVVQNFLGDCPSKVSLTALKTLSDSIKVGNPDQNKAVIDLAFRERTLALLHNNELMSEVRALLQLSASSAVEGICSASTPFLLISDLINTKPISEAEENFQFLEDTIKALKDASLFGSGRNILLRMCNDLLRRLSKSQNTVFCGRIQLFLTSLFPLNEKSGLNFTSNFNIDKEVSYSSEPDESLFHALTTTKDESDSSSKAPSSVTPVNADLYRKFWKLQELLKSPTICYTRDGWLSFVECTDCVVSTFQSIRLASGGSEESQWNEFTMFLTSEKLLDLQLIDRHFRRYILTQLLIIFQYLTAQVKFKNESQRLDEQQKQWIQKHEDTIFELLRRDSVSKTDVTEPVISHVLQRETHWNEWKNQGCPSFIREPEKSTLNPRKRRTNPLMERSGKKLYRFGNPALDELWSMVPDNLEACRDKRRLFAPSDLNEYFQDAILEMDPNEKVEEQYKRCNQESWTWRALRVLSRRNNQFYKNWNPPGRSVKDYLTDILSEDLESTEHKSNGTDTPQKISQSSSKLHSEKASPSPHQESLKKSITGVPKTSSNENTASSTPKPGSLLSEDVDNIGQDEEEDEELENLDEEEDTDGEAADDDDDLEESQSKTGIVSDAQGS